MSLDASLVWTGCVNDPDKIGGSVGLDDTTLRDGEQALGVVLTAEEKLEIAKALDCLGIQRIEAGFPRVTDEHRHAIELVAGAGLRAEVWGFARAVPDDVEAVVALGLTSTVIECPISDGKLKALGVHDPPAVEPYAFAAGRTHALDRARKEERHLLDQDQGTRVRGRRGRRRAHARPVRCSQGPSDAEAGSRDGGGADRARPRPPLNANSRTRPRWEQRGNA